MRPGSQWWQAGTEEKKWSQAESLEEVPFVFEENLLYFEGDKPLAQATQRENVESPFLDIFKSHLEAILFNLL